MKRGVVMGLLSNLFNKIKPTKPVTPKTTPTITPQSKIQNFFTGLFKPKKPENISVIPVAPTEKPKNKIKQFFQNIFKPKPEELPPVATPESEEIEAGWENITETLEETSVYDKIIGILSEIDNDKKIFGLSAFPEIGDFLIRSFQDNWSEAELLGTVNDYAEYIADNFDVIGEAIERFNAAYYKEVASFSIDQIMQIINVGEWDSSTSLAFNDLMSQYEDYGF